MGGTPYVTNIYHTDARGAATVMYCASSPFAVVLIQKEGYQTNSATLSHADFVVSLKKLK